MLVPMFMFYHVIWLMRSVKLGSCAHFEYGNYLQSYLQSHPIHPQLRVPSWPNLEHYIILSTTLDLVRFALYKVQIAYHRFIGGAFAPAEVQES